MPSSLHSQSYQAFRALLISSREAAGLTQVQVAERLGKPQSFVSKYERGERRLDFSEFVELSDVLDIDVAGFIRTYRATLSPKQKIKRLK
jgi:transcriptional regulator with XRE-family HTH domain